MRSLIPIIALAASAAAAQPRTGADHVVVVQLSSFAFSPETIRLRHGQPTVLRLVNAGRGGHNFSAPEFFAAASDISGAALRNGAVEVPSRQTYQLRLVPRRGTYRLRCTHTLHTAFGMRGEIVVE
jgi:plastocyanin